jgi:hypothetical protein
MENGRLCNQLIIRNYHVHFLFDLLVALPFLMFLVFFEAGFLPLVADFLATFAVFLATTFLAGEATGATGTTGVTVLVLLTLATTFVATGFLDCDLATALAILFFIMIITV